MLSPTFLMAYSAIHLIVSLCIDIQAILSPRIFAGPMKELVQWYTLTFKDPLMAQPPVWFQSCIWIELLFQCPYFVYGILLGKCQRESRLFGALSVIYGASTATTLIPILATFCNAAELSTVEKATLVIIYLPFLVIPMLIMIDFAFFTENNFIENKKKKIKY